MTGRRKRALVIAGVLALVLAAAGIAAWFVTSDGPSGRAGLGSIAAPIVTMPGTPPPGDCFPGDTCGLTISVSNPNPVAVALTRVDWTNPTLQIEKPIGTNNAACPVSNVILTADPLNLSPAVTIPPGSSSQVVPGVFTLSEDAPSACMGSYLYIGGSNHTWTFSTS